MSLDIENSVSVNIFSFLSNKRVNYISQIVRALQLVNFAGRHLPYRPQNLKGLGSLLGNSLMP